MRARRPARRRQAVAALLAAILAAVGLSVAVPAAAAPNQYAPSIGTLVSSPLTGATNVPFNIRTDKLCPSGTTVVNGFVDRPGTGWAEVLAIGGNTEVGSLTTGIPMSDTLVGIAQTGGVTLSDGSYQFSLVCYPDSFSPATAQFDGTFTITGTTFAFVTAGKSATTTTLAVSPAGSAAQGAEVTLTATVASTGTGTIAGTVQFADTVGGTPVAVGGPVTVTGGQATLRTTELAVGAHSLRATYEPSASAPFTGSSSTAVAYTVIGAGQTVTTTALAVSPAGTAAAGSPVTLTATVSPAAAAGSVTFLSSGGAMGAAVAVSGGTATFTTSTLTAGSYSLAASFEPADTATYTSSMSDSVPYTITGGGGGGGVPRFLDDVSVGVAARNFGTVTDPVTLTATTPCPATAATVSARLFGPGAWANGADVIANGTPATAGGFAIEAESVAATASTAGLAVVPGAYHYELQCLDPAGAVLGFFLGRLWFYDAVHWLNRDPAKVGIPTKTALAVTPDARAVLGAKVTMTATLDQGAATGQIRFQTTDNSENVTVLATVALKDGKASWSSTKLGLGLYYLAAVYVPAAATYNASTSPEVVFASTKIAPPLPGGPARVAGTPQVGRTLTCNGSFTGATTLAYVWFRDGGGLNSARSRTYKVAAADRGHRLSCRITAVNAGGAVTRTSAGVRVAG